MPRVFPVAFNILVKENPNQNYFKEKLSNNLYFDIYEIYALR